MSHCPSDPRIWSSWQLSLSVILSVSRAEIQFISGGDFHHYRPANHQRKLNQLPEGSLPNWIFTLPISFNNLSQIYILETTTKSHKQKEKTIFFYLKFYLNTKTMASHYCECSLTTFIFPHPSILPSFHTNLPFCPRAVPVPTVLLLVKCFSKLFMAKNL